LVLTQPILLIFEILSKWREERICSWTVYWRS